MKKNALKTRSIVLCVVVVVAVALIGYFVFKALGSKIDASSLGGVEICDNGIDDNGDGIVDGCWDPGNNYRITGKTYQVSTNLDLANAAQSAVAGDGILINSGTYSQTIVMANAGTPDKPIIVKGVGPTKPVIRAGGVNNGHIIPKSNTIIENIKTDGIQTVTSQGHGLGGYGLYLTAENNVSNILVKDCVFTQHEKGIRAEEGERLIVRNTLIENTEWGTYIGTDNDSGPALEFGDTLWENVEVANSVYDYWNTDGFLVEGNTAHHVFRNCKAHGWHDGGFDLKGHAIVENSVSYSNGSGKGSGEGFKIWRDGLVRNSIAYDNEYANYLFGGYDPGWKLVNSLSYNGRISIEDRPPDSSSQLSASSVKISHNIFINSTFNDEIEDKTGVSAFTYADHNLFSGGSPSSVGTSAKTLDPRVQSLSSRDFHLILGSPAIDAGSATLAPLMSSIDLDGKSRKIGTAVDIGPYEFGTTPSQSQTPVVVSPSPVISARPSLVPSPIPSYRPSIVASPSLSFTRSPSNSGVVGTESINKPPVINPIVPRSVIAGKTLTFNISAVDPEGGAIRYRITLPDGTITAGKQFYWKPNSNQFGSYLATVRATDPLNAYSERTIEIKVIKTVSIFETRWLNVENSLDKPDVSFQICRRSTYSSKYTEVVTFSDGSNYLQINEPGRSACTDYYSHHYQTGTFMMTLYLCTKDSGGNLTSCFPNRTQLIKR